MTDVENSAAITVEQIAQYEDDIETGNVIMLDTGWDQYHGHTNEWYFELPT